LVIPFGLDLLAVNLTGSFRRTFTTGLAGELARFPIEFCENLFALRASQIRSAAPGG
jgi:hypothetical protein